MPRETDEELMAGFQNGDNSALEELFARYQKPLYNFFLRMVGRKETAEDLVQDTFIKVYRFGKSFRGNDAKFSTWLYSVASNQCRDQMRYSSRRPETPIADIVEPDQTESFTDLVSETEESPVEDHMMRMEVGSIIQDAIDKLPEKEKKAIILREYQELDYKEIAEILNCPIGSVKILIFRARKRLRGLLQNADLSL
jgi:RNA polymerase sigma-70 factor (ECF subfamily)